MRSFLLFVVHFIQLLRRLHAHKRTHTQSQSQSHTQSHTQEVIARLNAIAPTDIVIPDTPSPAGSHNNSGRLKSSQGGASSARGGEADAVAVAVVKSSSMQNREGGDKGGKAGGGTVSIPETPQVHRHHQHVLAY